MLRCVVSRRENNMKKITVFIVIILLLAACRSKEAEFDVSKTMKGKWVSYISSINGDLILNIYNDGENKKMLMSSEKFELQGIVPFSCELEEDHLKFTMNSDESHRIAIDLKMTETGDLKGNFTQYGNTKDIFFKKISDIPDEYEAPDPFNNMTAEERIHLLKEYSEYEKGGERPLFIVKTGEKLKYEDIINEYGLDEKTKGLEDTALMIALLNWVCDNFNHDGFSGLPENSDISALIEFHQKNDGINCRGLSLILAEILRAYGIDARHVTCMPEEEPFIDCHVVVHAYSAELHQWVMLDPSNRLILMDEEGNYIDLWSLRNSYIDGSKITALNLTGKDIQGSELKYYLEYMAKNTFRFEMDSVFDYASDGMQNKTIYNLIPKGYKTIRRGATAITDPEYFWALPE